MSGDWRTGLREPGRRELVSNQACLTGCGTNVASGQNDDVTTCEG